MLGKLKCHNGLHLTPVLREQLRHCGVPQGHRRRLAALRRPHLYDVTQEGGLSTQPGRQRRLARHRLPAAAQCTQQHGTPPLWRLVCEDGRLARGLECFEGRQYTALQQVASKPAALILTSRETCLQMEA